jgi:hypothetical protein
MKKLLLCLILISFFIKVNAQCDYADYSDAPEELFRKRVKEPEMRYGNPYTMFVRGDDFNLEEILTQIRNNIRKGTPSLKENLNIYANLYKPPTVRSLVCWAIA